MFGWVYGTYSKCSISTLFNRESECEWNEKMIPRITLLLFFISSVAVAVLVSIFPDLSYFFGRKTQLSLTSTTGKQTGLRRVNFCSMGDHMHMDSGVAKIKYETSVQRVKKPIVEDKPNSDITVEATASVHLAKDMYHQGKMEKAMKLFQHAMALDPTQPDILNEYGEFLETTQKDVLEAEHMYCRALVISPSHTRALSNRKRTLPLVEEIDHATFSKIDRKRDMLLQVPENHPGLRRMIQENYFRYIYHTAAIEGNTFTLSQTRSFVETRIVISGKSIIEHNEILGMEQALNFVNNSLIHRIGSITKQDIVEIHRRVLGFVDPIGAGLYRTTQVFVGDFTPPPASDIRDLVDEFIDWLNSEDALNLHPIELAAIAHYKLVYIHPFYDGNGRTSRLLMNLILMQAGYPPVIIKVQDRADYYLHLQTANNGDIRPFIRFIAYCTDIAIDEYLIATIETHNISFPGISVRRDDDRTIIIEQEPESNSSSEKLHGA